MIRGGLRKLGMGILLFGMAVCCYTAAPVKAAEASDVPIDDKTFPDAKFLEYVGQFDDGDGRLSEAERNAVTEITVNRKEIASLAGIEYFPKLTKLECGNNNLPELDVSKNTELLDLDCSYNQLTDLNISGATALKTLICDQNRLTRLDICDSSELTYLSCKYNQITELDLSQNTQLQGLYCTNNDLSTLDVSKNPNLTSLDCEHNWLTTLELKTNTKLEYLRCAYNRLTSLDVSSNTALRDLYTLHNANIMNLDVSKNLNLSTLECEDNGLTSLDVSANTNLFHLNCANNKLKSLDLSKNPDLSTLNCNGNEIDGLDFRQNSKLSSPEFAQNPLKVLKLTPEYSDNTYYSEMNYLTDVAEIDMGQISGWDADSIENINGATLVDNVLVFNLTEEDISSEAAIDKEVTYTYDCGHNFTLAVTLTIRLNPYQITYELNGGTNAETNPTFYHPLPKVIPLQNPVKEDYIFDGWYSDAEFTSKMPEIPRGHAGNITLYAKWTEVPKPTPTPIPTPTAVPTPTIAPTATPSPVPTIPAAPSPTPTTPATSSPAPTTPAAPSPTPTTPTQSATPAPTQQPTAQPTQKPTEAPAEEGNEEGTFIKDSQGSTFKITNANSENPEVQYEAPAKNAKGKVKIPAFVKVNGVTYQVTSVSGKAFKGNSKVTKIIIGKNVTKIGKKAFSKCKKLKLLVIKSRKLKAKNVAKDAFKGITKKTIVKVPKSKIKEYRKLLRKKGLSNKVKAIKRVYSSQEV